MPSSPCAPNSADAMRISGCVAQNGRSRDSSPKSDVPSERCIQMYYLLLLYRRLGEEAVSKKWYNMFVSVDASSGTGEETPEAPPADAARMVAEIAASVPTTATFSAPVANPSSFGEIYDAAEIA